MKITIYHTNDIHSNYDFLKKVHTYLLAHKSEQDLYLDSGDYTDLKSFLVQSDQGISAMDLFLKCGLDAMALGNNEIDMGYEAVRKLAQEGFPITSCNTVQNDDQAIEGLCRSIILEKAKKRFLLIGIAPYYSFKMVAGAYNLFFMMGNIKTLEPVRQVKQELKRQAGKYDYCILLSHSGYSVDMEILSQLPEVDFCLGGHSHTLISEAGYSQSGRGQYLAKITLDLADHKMLEVENIQIDPENKDNPLFDSWLREKEIAADQVVSKELDIVEELDFDPFRESRLINFVCDCLHKHFGGDLAIMHSGIADRALVRPVSIRNLLETFPSKLNPTFYRLKGEKIIEAVKLSLDPDHIRTDGLGAGFRGKVLGTLGFSYNVKIRPDPFCIMVDDKEIQAQKEYRLVTDDYLQRGTGYPSLRVSNEQASYDKWFIRDLVYHYLQDQEVFTRAKIRRRQGS